jgi:hypothetical protein
MFSRLRQPGGVIGGLSVTAVWVLGFFGILGVGSIGIALIAGSEWWSDQRSEQAFGLLFFAIVLGGAVGFVIMDRQPWLGGGLAVVGSLAFAVILVWLILPVLLGLVFAVTAVLRARALGHVPASPPTGHAPA